MKDGRTRKKRWDVNIRKIVTVHFKANTVGINHTIPEDRTVFYVTSPSNPFLTDNSQLSLSPLRLSGLAARRVDLENFSCAGQDQTVLLQNSLQASRNTEQDCEKPLKRANEHMTTRLKMAKDRTTTKATKTLLRLYKQR